MLESALARPQQKWQYADNPDTPALAAAYAFGLVKNHPYRDGNKRIGFLAMVTFLGLNGHELEATDAEVVAEVIALADGSSSEESLADWIRQHRTKHRLRTSLGPRLLVIGLFLLSATTAFAQQRPLVTEDPVTIGDGRVLIEAGFEYQHQLQIPLYGLTGNLVHLPAVGVNLGLGSRAEIQIDAGYRWLDVTDRHEAPLSSILDIPGHSTHSEDDVVIATKLRLVAEHDHRPSIGFRLATKLPNAPNQTGLGTDMTDFSFSVLVGKSLGSTRIVGNLGMGIVGDPTENAVQHDPMLYGVSVAHAVSPRLSVVGEVEGQYLSYTIFPSPGAEDRSAARGGFRYAWRSVRLDAAIVTGLADRSPKVGFTTGVTWIFQAFSTP